MYLTATFPYVVTTAFLARSSTLDGAMDGLLYMISPDVCFYNKYLFWHKYKKNKTSKKLSILKTL